MLKAKALIVIIGLLLISVTVLVEGFFAPGWAASTTSCPKDASAQANSFEERRARCDFEAGATVLESLGIGDEERAAILIEHIIILMQENRSFDHYLGRLPQFGHTDVEGIPPNYTNRDGRGGTVSPAHATTTCISPDTPHSWTATHNAWNGGAMDGFYIAASVSRQDGQRALAWYDESDIPFYYWLYSTYSMADRFFCPVLGPTWPNRDYLYAATSDGVKANNRVITVRNIFDALNDAGIAWGIYVDRTPRQNCIGFSRSTPGVYSTAAFYEALADGSLPQVVFIDGTGPDQDEHPPNDINKGENWVRDVYLAVTQSPLWSTTALFLTYDEGGGFFDHVSPPTTCPPTHDAATVRDFSQLGVRIPAAVISPFAKPGYVSHIDHETTSITRFIELIYDLPALTARDANVDAMLDMFDFENPQFLTPPSNPPAAGGGGCR
ncbi:MAG: alkaline phosphatase family protein [Acidobacteria bacterium]|nr:alkaline phosphatase family protein [Acidobacteriota bacterium]MBI3656942.1 alkaline phosphatase family protein [Acidobacteriota bacterium]